MIFVIAPGTLEVVPLGDLFRMKLPLRYGWEGWIWKDKTTGQTRRFRSYRAMRAYLTQPAH